MLKKLADLKKLVQQKSSKATLVLAAADDNHALHAAYHAYNDKLINLVLVGNRNNILNLSAELKCDLSEVTIIDEPDVNKAVELSVKYVRDTNADILMKGNVSTAPLLKGVLNKEWGLRKSELLSHLSIFEIKNYHKLLAITDVAMNIKPDLKEKVGILNNAVEFLNKLGIHKPKVAPVAAVEVVNENMPATLDASILTTMNKRGQIKNCIVDGPLALDNAVSTESAKHKGIKSEVAGDADLILVPNIETGNVLYKSLAFLTDAKLAAVILGAMVPVVLTSRSDSDEAKYNSILLAAAVG